MKLLLLLTFLSALFALVGNGGRIVYFEWGVFSRSTSLEFDPKEHGWMNFRRDKWMNQYGAGYELFVGPFRFAWSKVAGE